MTIEQRRVALSVIQALIVQARFQAFEAGANQVADLLDDVELLPLLLAENRDEDFDELLRGVVEKHPECQYVLEQFAASEPPPLASGCLSG